MAASIKVAVVHFMVFILIITNHLTTVVCSATFGLKQQVHKLNVDQKRHYNIGEAEAEQLQVFCHDAKWQPILARSMKSFTTSQVQITSSFGSKFDYKLYIGDNQTHVVDKYKADSSFFWSFASWNVPWKADIIRLRPFNETCVAVYTKQPYSVKLTVKVVDVFLVTCLIVGLVLFLSARSLSRNVVFYYGTGVSIGVLASLLIAVYVFSRFVPFKKGVSVFIVTGWSLALVALQYLWEHSYWLLENHYHYVLGYFLTAAVLSFAVCYWKGPVTNQRTLDIITWTIQLLALILIYNSIQVLEVAVLLIIAILTLYNIPLFLPRRLFNMIFGVWKKRFPGKRKLLSREEYARQGQEETRKALEELRKYCRSPDCDAWKVVSRVSSPQKFARFVEGDSHLSEDEITLYEEDILPDMPEISEDEDEIDFRLNSL